MKQPGTTRRSKGIEATLPIGLAILTLLIAGRHITEGGFSWSDAPLHAMDGAFLHDLATERPTGSLQDWARQYYVRHQCLGIIVYYPPLFAAVEAVMFVFTGVSVWAARLTVLLFAVGAVWLIYLFARRLFGLTAGLAAAVLAIASPSGADWSQQVMLEWPATFFIVLALYGYCRYLQHSGWGSGLATTAACAAAYLTKQTAAFALVLIILHAWWDHRWRKLIKPSFVVPMVVALLVIVGYGAATAGYNALAPQLMFGSPPLRHLLNSNAWTWYLKPSRLEANFGWPMLFGTALAILVGLTVYLRNYLRLVQRALRPRQPQTGPAVPEDQCDDNKDSLANMFTLPAAWAFLWWLICVAIAAKEERYLFFAVPALACITAAGAVQLNRRRRIGIGSAILVALCCSQVIIALRAPVRRLPTMTPTVDFLVARSDADLVLVDAVRDGQFIFDVRTSPTARDRIIPMRASKFLYSRAARTRYNYESHISTAAQLYDWLDRYGIRYIVMEDRLPTTADRSWDVAPRIMLRETVANNPLFEKVHTQSLAGNHPDWADVNLVTYRYLAAKPRQSDTITINIPAMKRQVTIPLPPVASHPE